MAKRKPKTQKQLARKKSSRPIYQRFLIVCEGETERIYLNGIKTEFQLGKTKEIIIPDDNASSPISIVDYAELKYHEDSKDNEGNEYNYVFCVIDRDIHQTYSKALAKINTLNGKIPNCQFQLFLSDPCIEYWFLLHYIYTDKPYNSKGKKSRAKCVISDLKRFEPKYAKNNNKIITGFISKLDTASKHAEKSLKDSQIRGNTNPSSNFHLLIKKLCEK